jgi:ATP-dependent RNA helicase DeaD
MMLRGARISRRMDRRAAPRTIRRQDSERLLAALLAPVEADDEDRALAAELLANAAPEDIAAAAGARAPRRLPEPEELIAAEAAPAARHAPGFEDSAWFRMNIGRRQNADPRWILPLLCRRGHVTRNEIGAIRITTQRDRYSRRSPRGFSLPSAAPRTMRTMVSKS